jgi:hypothetical protein
MENDGIIQKMKKKRAGLFHILSLEEKEGDNTEYGKIILPDREGWGPIYYCLLQKSK